MGSSAAAGKTQLSLTIILMNTALPVRIQDVEFLNADDDVAEVLLDIPFLKAIGFDFGNHLQNVGAEIDGRSEEELKSETARIASTTFKGLSYEEAYDDPIERPECLQAGFGIDSDEVIQQTVLKAVEDAKNNRMSTTRTKALKSVLEPYRDCFRINIGPELPVKIQPLSMHLKPSSKLFRCT